MTRPRSALACWLALALLAGCHARSSSEPSTFTAADLAGDWRFTIVMQGPAVAAGTIPGWARGTIRFDATGAGQVQEQTDSSGNHPPLRAVTWQVAADGTVTADGTTGYTAFHGRMSRARDLVVATATQSGVATLRIYQKVAAGRTWHLQDVVGSHWLHDLTTGADVGWEHSRAAFAADGVVSLAERVSPSGPEDPVASAATVAVSGDGIVTADVAATWQGYLSSGGDLLVATHVVDAGARRYGLQVITRAASGLATDDFAGAQSVHLLSATTGGAGAWMYGDATADAAGHVVFGDWFDPSGAIALTDTPTVSVAGDGELLQDGSPGYHGALLPVKDVAVILNASEDGMGSIGFSIR